MSEVCLAPCLICGIEMRNFDPPNGNHPLGGLEFQTPGHYGSRLFDMEPGRLVVSICDGCVESASLAERVLHSRPPTGAFVKWSPASVDTDPKGGDAKQAPCGSSIGSAVPPEEAGDAQTQSNPQSEQGHDG